MLWDISITFGTSKMFRNIINRNVENFVKLEKTPKELKKYKGAV